MGRGPPTPGARLVDPGTGRRAPGGGGMGRPVALNGRPGGGGMGRPVALSGGRIGAAPSPALVPSPVGRCVGRMVVGPSGDAALVGTGLGTTALLRTTLGPEDSTGAVAGAGVSAPDGSAEVTGAAVATTSFSVRCTRVVRTGASACGALATTGAGASATGLAAGSGSTTRRSPSASARRRIRSACASSIEAEGLDAPIPSFWASSSNSLLVSPSSFESSCTRIFFCAKTFP